MITGHVTISKPQDVVREKLRTLLAGANCEVLESDRTQVVFRHGTYLTQTAALFPKTCRVRFGEGDGTTTVSYEIHVAPLVRVWLTLWGILFCWTIFAPVFAHRVLVYHPKRFMENLLAGI